MDDLRPTVENAAGGVLTLEQAYLKDQAAHGKSEAPSMSTPTNFIPAKTEKEKLVESYRTPEQPGAKEEFQKNMELIGTTFLTTTPATGAIAGAAKLGLGIGGTKFGLAVSKAGVKALGVVDDAVKATLGPIAKPIGKAITSTKVGKYLFATDDRIRVNELSNTRDYHIVAGERANEKFARELEELVPELDRRTLITHTLDGTYKGPLLPNEQEAVTLARRYFNSYATQAVSSGVLKAARDDYVTHLWDFGRQSNAFRTGAMSPNSPFAKARTFSSLAEGKAAGLTPLTEDVAQITRIYGNSMGKAIANADFLEALKSAQVPFSSKQVIKGMPPMQSLIMQANDAPRNYEFINHPLLRGYAIHPDIVPSLKFMFEHQDTPTWLKGLTALNTATKRLNVSVSLFHHKSLIDAYIGAGGNVTKIPKMLNGTDDMLKMLRKGGAGDNVDWALKGGTIITMGKEAIPAVEDVGGDFYSGMRSLQGYLDSIHPALGLPVKKFEQLNHLNDKYLWERLQAGMKLNTFSVNFEKLLLKNPELSKEAAAEIAASYTNDIFGSLNWRRIAEGARTRFGRDFSLSILSPASRRGLQLLMFAPDWTLSTTRAMVKALGGGIKGTELSRLHRAYIARSAIYYFVVGNAINERMSGHSIWENRPRVKRGQVPTIADKLDAMTYLDMGDGRRMQFSKHAIEPFHWLLNPRQQFLSKLAAVPSEAAEQFTGKEYLSVKGAPDIKNRGLHLAKRFMPIAGQQGLGPLALSSLAGVPIYGKTYEEQAIAKAEKQRKAREKRAATKERRALTGERRQSE